MKSFQVFSSFLFMPSAAFDIPLNVSNVFSTILNVKILFRFQVLEFYPRLGGCSAPPYGIKRRRNVGPGTSPALEALKGT